MQANITPTALAELDRKISSMHVIINRVYSPANQSRIPFFAIDQSEAAVGEWSEAHHDACCRRCREHT